MSENIRKKIDFSSKEVITSSLDISKNKGEISISDLEKVIALFRKNGSEAKLLAFLRGLNNSSASLASSGDLSGTGASQTNRYKDYYENTFLEFKDFLINKLKKVEPHRQSRWQLHALRRAKPSEASSFAEATEDYPFRIHLQTEVWSILRRRLKINRALKFFKNSYIKRVLGFFGIFFAIYFTLNLPIYYNRISWFLKGTEKKTVKVSELVQTPMAKSAPLEAGEVITPDSRLLISKLNVNVPIVFIDSQKEEDVQTGLQNGVIRFGGMSNPGEAGNTYLIGHSSNFWWDKGKYNYVFVLLDKLEVGNTAKIYHNGNKYLYEVISKELVEPNDTASLNQINEPILTLMTCYPPGTTNKRLIVRLKQTLPKYFAPRVVEKEKVIEFPKKLPTADSGSFFGSLKKFFFRND